MILVVGGTGTADEGPGRRIGHNSAGFGPDCGARGGAGQACRGVDSLQLSNGVEARPRRNTAEGEGALIVKPRLAGGLLVVFVFALLGGQDQAETNNCANSDPTFQVVSFIICRLSSLNPPSAPKGLRRGPVPPRGVKMGCWGCINPKSTKRRITGKRGKN